MTDVEAAKPNEVVAEKSERPWAYRALCKVAGAFAVLCSLPALAAACLGVALILIEPDAPAWALGAMGVLAVFAIGMTSLGALIFLEKSWAAAIMAALYAYFSVLQLTKGNALPAAMALVNLALCLAVVIAAWRLRPSGRRPATGGAE